MKSQRTKIPASTSQTTGEMPNQLGPPDLGWNQPQTPDLRTPKTISPRPSADRTPPTTSSFGRSSGTESCCLREKKRITAASSTSPANTQRHEKYVVAKPPISGPTATAIAPAAATIP